MRIFSANTFQLNTPCKTALCFRVSTWLVALFFSFSLFAENPMKVKQYNLSSFSKTEKIISEELKNLTPKAQQQHPEFGILPYNAQCNDCVELLQKRTEHERYFVKNGSKGKHFYAQKSLQPLHYKNEKQEWITIDWRLFPQGNNLYTAQNQNFPTAFNANTNETSLSVSQFNFQFNKNLSKYFLDNKGNKLQPENASYQNETIGHEGAKFETAWQHINIEHIYKQHGIKTNFVLLQPLSLSPNIEWLVFEDVVQLPENYYFTKQENALALFNAEKKHIITYKQPAFYDGYSYGIMGHYELEQQGNNWLIKVMVPASLLKDKKVHYPLTIDPLVTVGPQGIGEFKVAFPATFNSANMAFTLSTNGSCDYSITFLGLGTSNLVNTFLDVEYENEFTPCAPNLNPPFCEFSNVSMEVIGPCNTSTGQLICNPAQPPFNGTCTTDPLKVPGATRIRIPNFLNCIEAQCPDYELTFSIKNRTFKCNDLCGTTCAIGHRFAVTLEGRTIEERVTITDDFICAGQPVNVISLPLYGVPPYTYSWAPTGLTDSIITVNPEATSFYSCTVTDACGNTAVADTLINVVPSPDADAGGPFTVCEGDTIQLGGNPTSTDGFNFLWSAVPPANINWLSAANISNPAIFAPLDTLGSFTFVVNVSNNTCFRNDTATVNIVPLPQPVIQPDSNLFICEGGSLTLQTETPYDTYLWSNGATTASINITQPGNYSVTVTQQNCTGSSSAVTAAIKPILPFQILPRDTSFNLGGSVTYSATIDLTAPAIDNFYWEPNTEISCTICENPTTTPTIDRFYYLYVEQDGCLSVDSAFVNITFPNSYVIPTAFSPNNDGKNDRFYIIKQSGVKVLEFKVFNRWGELVHDNPNFAWDGFYKDELQDMEVFSYFFKLELSGGTQEIAKGNVTLVK
jgi:gliding motility-associated-like protein